MMLRHLLLSAAGLLACGAPALAQADPAPTGTLRAVYLGTNPAQAQRNPQTGELGGASFDLATDLARRLGKPLDFKPAANPPAVIEAVRSGQADIGFVAYEATRVGPVAFSQTYMINQQSFLVLGDSPIKAVADVDRPGRKIAGTRNDSVTLCMKRVLKQASLVELENDPAGVTRALEAREIDAFGASRARLTALARDLRGARLLPDDFFTVPQNIVVAGGRPDALAEINAFIDDVRASGFLSRAVEKSGVIGLAPAAPGPVTQHGCRGQILRAGRMSHAVTS
jgi:polar amino acid transport system substrate-binding protein